MASLEVRLDRLEKEIRRLRSIQERPGIVATFTPTFRGTGTAGTFTYTAQRGVVCKIGNLVLFWVQVAISAISVAPTGTMQIAGLPYTSADNNSTPYSVSVGTSSNIDYPTGVLEITARINAGQTVVDLLVSSDNAGAAGYPAASFTNVDASVAVGGCYATE